MPTRLILNADDFGLTRGINHAIEDLHHAGALTSATLMATGPAFEDAVTVALRNPTLGVGCHLVFTDGVPVSHPHDIQSLLGADGKTFRPSLPDFAQALLRGTVRMEELAREAQAQIQKLQRASIDVTHIDSHKHTHLFPAVARPVLYVAERCGVRAFRYPCEPRWSRNLKVNGAPLSRRLAQAAFDLFEPGFRRAINLNTDEKTTSGTLGIAATGTLTTVNLLTLLEQAARQPAGSLFELCCHPGFHDADLDQQRTRLRNSREVEYKALLAVVPELSRTPGTFELIHYGNLGVPGLQRATCQFTPCTGYEKVL